MHVAYDENVDNAGGSLVASKFKPKNPTTPFGRNVGGVGGVAASSTKRKPFGVKHMAAVSTFFFFFKIFSRFLC